MCYKNGFLSCSEKLTQAERKSPGVTEALKIYI